MGDRAPADARVLEAANLKVDEAALTGESLPVTKRAERIDGEVGLGDRINMLYAGTHNHVWPRPRDRRPHRDGHRGWADRRPDRDGGQTSRRRSSRSWIAPASA